MELKDKNLKIVDNVKTITDKILDYIYHKESKIENEDERLLSTDDNTILLRAETNSILETILFKNLKEAVKENRR